jgi:hypothetical protein
MAEEDAQLAADGRTRTSEITAAEKALELHLPADMTIEQFLALAKDPDMDAKISERERAIEAIRQVGRSAPTPASSKSPCRNFQQPSTRCWRAPSTTLPVTQRSASPIILPRTRAWSGSRMVGSTRPAIPVPYAARASKSCLVAAYRAVRRSG